MINLEAIVDNLTAFYPLEGKRIIHVGVGGGILTGYSGTAKEIVGIDSNPAIEPILAAKLKAENLTGKFQVRIMDFIDYAQRADVVFFEFCLHEMENPLASIMHALTIAPTVLIADHSRNSQWSWYGCETEKLERSWTAINQFDVRHRAKFEETQRFDSFEDLHQKLSVLGAESLARIELLRNEHPIGIPMPYEVCLL